MYKSIGASAGVGIGKAVLIKDKSLTYENKNVTDTASEIARYKDAIKKFCDKTSSLADDIRKNVGEKEAEILNGQILMISDPSMGLEIEGLINAGQCSEAAVESVCDMFIQVFSNVEDEMMRQRATDIGDIKTRLLKILLDIEDIDIKSLPKGTVIVAKDLTPSMTAGIVKGNIEGIVTEVGGKTSHSAILSRALEIPAVLSVEKITDNISNGDTVIVDGTNGIVIKDPDEETVKKYSDIKEKYIKDKNELKKYIGRPTITKDGKKVELFGNIGNTEDASAVNEHDGEGVGLFRTEFLFMGRSSLPSEEEQYEAYKKVASALKGKSVIIRTLDVGGDKEIPYLGLEKEENPFLGYRAVRFCLDRDDIYMPQLRALLRASAFGDIRIMIPLVTCVDELRSVKEKVEKIKIEFNEKNIAYNKDIKIGVMIETPAASIIADILAKEADFFSIGTNDLTQYTMAVDRGNAKVEYLYSAYNPAVIRSIKRIIECGKKEGIEVGMCGEAAADPMLIPLLISFGLDEFSVTPTSILSTRKVIESWSKEEADELAKKVMELSAMKDVYSILKENMK